MADLLRLLFLVPLGFIAAVFAAALTMIAGWYGHAPGVLTDMTATSYVIGVGVWMVFEIGALTAIPAFILVILAELFGWRSVFFYLAAGGALGALAGGLNGLIWETPHNQLLLLAAGFVGGLAYWLVAGRLAGLARAPEPPPPRPPISSE